MRADRTTGTGRERRTLRGERRGTTHRSCLRPRRRRGPSFIVETRDARTDTRAPRRRAITRRRATNPPIRDRPSHANVSSWSSDLEFDPPARSDHRLPPHPQKSPRRIRLIGPLSRPRRHALKTYSELDAAHARTSGPQDATHRKILWRTGGAVHGGRLPIVLDRRARWATPAPSSPSTPTRRPSPPRAHV